MLGIRGIESGRRVALAVVVAVALLAAACGGDDDVSPAASGDVTSSAPTEPTTSSTEPASPPVVEPKVLCANGTVAYLGYTNESDSTVTLPVGAFNELLSPDGEVVESDNIPTVFAPGEQDLVAFWVPTGSVWTLGDLPVQRSVIANDEFAPTCDDDDPVPADTRSGEFVHTVDVTRDADGRIVAASLTLDVEGRGESRCPSGPVEWSPNPMEVVFAEWRPSADDDVVSPAPMVVEIEDARAETVTPVGDIVRGYTEFALAVDATDVCTDPDGNEHRAWAASKSLLQASFGDREICFAIVESDDGEDFDEVGCHTLPATDGIRIRL